MKIPSAVRLVEVSPRDGLQNINHHIPTATKTELIRRLHGAGLRTIEVTSVVSPRAIPQLADCRGVLGDAFVQCLLTRDEESDDVDGDGGEQGTLRLPVLVPNRKGFEVAVEQGVREVAVFISASEGFSRANVNCGMEEALRRVRDVAGRASAMGVAVRGYVSCIFADPFDGPTPRASVLRCVRELLAMGCYEVSLGDTLGVGTPDQVRSLIAYLVEHDIPVSRLAGHFHDTYHTGAMNVWEAYRCGLRVFDSSVAGLGGCPYAPGSKGNVATETLVDMFHAAGVETGIDVPLLRETGRWIAGRVAAAAASSEATTGVSRVPSRKDKEESSVRSDGILQFDGEGGMSMAVHVGREVDWTCVLKTMLGR